MGSWLEQRQPQELKAMLDQENFAIHQIEEATGLKLAHFVLEEQGFRAKRLDRIVEISPNATSADWQLYSYEDVADRWSYSHSMLQEAIRELSAAYAARQKFLEQADMAWRHMRYRDDGLMMHFGLYRAFVRIKLEFLIKCHIELEEPSFFDGYILNFLPSGEVQLGFAWTEAAMPILENKLAFLDWKMEQYRKNDPRKERFRQLQAAKMQFLAWEKATFTTLDIPSD